MAFDAGAIKGYVTLDTRGWVRGVAMVNAGAGAMGVKMQWVGGTARRTGESFLQAVGAIQQLGAIALSVGATITSTIGGLGKSFIAFQKTMMDVTSVTETTNKEFAQMSAMAEKMSVRWGKPVEDLASAFLYLGRAGLTAQEQIQAFQPIVTASKAMMTGMEETAEGVINTIRAFGWQFADTGKAVDVISRAVNESTQNLEDMLVALSYAGKPAAAMNNSLQDLSAMLAAVSNQGIRGSKAGTALRFALTALASPAARAKDLMNRLGLEIYDTSTGKMRPMLDILAEMEDKFQGVSEKVRNMVLETVFGKRALPSMIALFDAGTKSVKEYSKSLSEDLGAATAVANKQMRSIGAQVDVVNQQFHMLMRHLGATLEPTMARMVNTLQKYIDKWVLLIDKNKEGINVLLKQAAALGLTLAKYGAIATILPTLITTFSGLVNIVFSPFGALIGGLVGLQAMFDLSLKDIASTVERWWKNLNDKVPIEKLMSFIGTPGIGFLATLALTKNWKLAAGVGAFSAGWNIGTTLQERARAGSAVTKSPTGLGIPGGIHNPNWYNLYKEQQMKATSTTPPTEGMSFWEKYKYYAKDDIDKIIKSLTDKLKGLVPPELQNALTEMQKLLKDLAKDATTADKLFWPFLRELSGLSDRENTLMSHAQTFAKTGYFPSQIRPNIEVQHGISYKGKAWSVMPNIAHDYSSLFDSKLVKTIENALDKIIDVTIPWSDRVAGVFKKFSHKVTEFVATPIREIKNNWGKALETTTETFLSWEQAVTQIQQSMIDGWSNAFEYLMQKGSSLKDFMSRMFNAIYMAFIQTMARIMAQKMFWELFKNGMGVWGSNLTTSAAASSWTSTLKGGLHLLNSVTTPTTMGSGYFSGQLHDYNFSSNKAAVPTTINVVNKSGVPMAMKQAGQPQFNGKEWVVSVVMDAVKTNPDFKLALNGGY